MGPRTQIAAGGLLLGLLVATAGAADSDDPIVAGDLGARLDRAVTETGGAGFWGGVLVAQGGEILLAKGYGAADYAKTPNTPRTLFELASASKQITAAAILHLEQRGKLSLGDTLDRIFEKVPGQARGITVHHLLTHTSSISGETGVPYASPIRRRKYVEQMLAAPQLDAEPGSKFEYCNAGYALLAAIVEQVSGTSFESYCEKHLFKPAGMKDTGFIGDKDLIKTGRASTRATDEPGKWTAADWHWGWGYRGMGGTVTTVLDLHRWDRALRGDAVLGDEARKKYYAPFVDGYACGWRVETTERGTRKAHHSGSVRGFGANLIRFLEDDAEVYVLSNDPKAAYEVSTALEKLLFPPVAIEATIDPSPYGMTREPVKTFTQDLAWSVKRKKRQVAIILRHRKHALLEIRAPKGYAAGVLGSLRAAIAAREKDDAGDPAAIEAGLYLQPYDRSGRIELSEQLTLSIRPEYRGRGEDGEPIVDRRVLVVLVDDEHGQWPVMVKMNVAAARKLEAGLAKAAR